MPNPTGHQSRSRVISPILVSIFLIGSGATCTSQKQYPGSGQIYIDSPEVFTRERLVNRRLSEQAWLEKQLNNDAEFSLQGYRDVREFTGMALALKGQFDPLGGVQATSLRDEVQRNSRISELQDDLQLEVLRKQLADIRAMTNGLPITAAQITATNGPTLPSNITNPLGSQGVTINLGTFNTNTIPPVPNFSNLETSKAKLTSIQTLDDKLAFRNAIQARLREQELDDTHDQRGLTLYTLKFDVSVQPGQNNPLGAKVAVSVVDCSPFSKEDYNRWIKSLAQQIRTETIALQQRYLMNFLTEDELAQLKVYSTATQQRGWTTLKSATNTDHIKFPELSVGPLSTDLQITTARVSAETRQLPTLTPALRRIEAVRGLFAELAAGKPGSNGCMALVLMIKDRYEDALEGAASIPSDSEISDPIAFLGTNQIWSFAPKGAPTGYQILTNKLESANSSYVYLVEPKEYAQNISDVAAIEKVRSFALALSALIPNTGASVAGNYESIRHSTELLEALKRSPLVSGYADGTTNFGWILGPKFAITGNKASWSQTPIQHSVQASLVVPGWSRYVKLRTETSWLNADGTRLGVARTNLVSTHLPQDYGAITRLLLAESDPSLNLPSIIPQWRKDPLQQKFVLREGDDEYLLIRGRDLWRNPEVYVGSQKADQVNVLPDMNGLRALVKSVHRPATEDKGEQVVDLSVVTSDGVAVLRDSVRILPSKVSTSLEQKPFLDLLAETLVKGDSIAFGVDDASLPKSFHELSVRLFRPAINSTVTFAVPSSSLPKGKSWVLSIDSSVLTPFKTELIALDVMLRISPDPDRKAISVLSGGPKSVAFFESRDAQKLAVMNKEIKPGDAIVLKLDSGSSLYELAYPGLSNSLAERRFSMQFLATGAANPVTATVKSVTQSSQDDTYRVILNDYTNLVGQTYIVSLKLDRSPIDPILVPLRDQIKVVKN